MAKKSPDEASLPGHGVNGGGGSLSEPVRDLPEQFEVLPGFVSKAQPAEKIESDECQDGDGYL